LKFEPRAYQPPAIDFLYGQGRCNLWAGMGLGKTVTTLSAVDAIQLAEPSPALVVAPLRVARDVWATEAAKWDHLKHLEVEFIGGSPKDRALLARSQAAVHTINYENVEWLIDFWGESWPYKLVVSDESTKLKGFRLRQGTRRARALGKVAHTKVKRWVNLTGTPSPNGLQDLWGQQWFIDQGRRLGRSFSSFEARWFDRGFDGFSIKPRSYARDQIMESLADCTMSIDAKDYFDLDEPIVTKVEVQLPRSARAQYEEMEKEFFTQVQGEDIEALTAAAKSQKCLQMANGAVYTTAPDWKEVHNEKLDALESIIEELAGSPLLVAYHFVSDLARLRRRFPAGRELDHNPATLVAWNAGEIHLLFAHPKSAGHGLNLQDGGHHIAFFSQDWNLEEQLQVLERIGPVRQMQSGYKRPVFVYHILAKDTLDEVVMARREGKKETQDILMDYMKRKQP
jgi:SNF2 family DNA or RNA helicase